MSSLPLTLNYGEVSLYHIKNRSDINRIKAPDNFNWGSIYSISPYGVVYAVVGQQVLFSGADVRCVLAFHGKQYPIINETRLVTLGENNP